MNIALYMPNAERLAWWVDHLGNLLPEHTVCSHLDIDDPATVDIAIVWRPPAGWLASLSRLKLTVSIGAGIDHIIEDESYPSHIPILKTIGPDMVQRMREYVVQHVLNLHRCLPALQQQQAQARWNQFVTPTARQCKVGIMGLGDMGRASALALSTLGFVVSAWSRSPRELQGITTYAGSRELSAFLRDINILVCLLPLTSNTRSILNKELFQQLPKGACLVNVARGQHLVEQDLLDALASEQIARATLDVFIQEPLSPEHPFWLHKNILVTPHVASLIDPVSGGQVIANNIRRFANGEREQLNTLTDAARQY